MNIFELRRHAQKAQERHGTQHAARILALHGVAVWKAVLWLAKKQRGAL